MKASFLLTCIMFGIALHGEANDSIPTNNQTENHICFDWGFFGHKKINELAVYTLPEELFGFYKYNINYIIEHSVDPDKRRYSVKGEAECHYLDVDRYVTKDEPNPFNNLPERWTEAVSKYSEDTLRAHGIVPWNLYFTYTKLIQAFKNHDVQRVLRISAELGHYIGDIHVPLHSTSNYNGQKTNQRGIHAFWESRVPEIQFSEYDFFVGKAEYISAPQRFAWDRLKESYAAVDSVLSFESNLNAQFPADQKYTFERRGNAEVRTYSRAYAEAYSALLQGQVERRMKSAVFSLGSYWYTAWLEAGQPDVSGWFIQNKDEVEEPMPIPTLPVRQHENE